MKRLASIILAILLLAGCSAGTQNQKTLYDHGLELVAMLDEMTENESYLQVYTGNSMIAEIVTSMSAGDYSSPSAVYQITVSNENLSALGELSRIEDASEELQAFVKQRALATLVVQVNAMVGAETLAATSVCTAAKTFVSDEASSGMFYLYVYEDTPPVTVTFAPGEDSTVSASANFILYDGFTYGSAAEIAEFFSEVAPEVKQIVGN